MARLLSLNVGPPRDITWNVKTVRLNFAAKRRCRS